MRKACARVALLTFACMAFGLWAQSTSLVIRIQPESHLSPSSIPLSFTVVRPGETIVSEPVEVTGWVRSLPGQSIQLTVQTALTGPAGTVSGSRLSWTATQGRATGGGLTSTCTRGSFTGGAIQSLISGWSESGIATCNVSFALTTASDWPTGTYSGRAILALTMH